MMKYSIKEIVTGAPDDTQHQNNVPPKTSPIECDGVLLTKSQCHMVHIHIMIFLFEVLLTVTNVIAIVTGVIKN